MAETVFDWPAIFDAIEAELVAIQNSAGQAAFQQVIIGEPAGLPLQQKPIACAWYLGRTAPTFADSDRTFLNMMYAARVQIMVLWPIQIERVTLESWEADIATIDTNIRRALRSNSVLGGECTDLDILDSDVTYGELPRPTPPGQAQVWGLYRVLSMELRLDNLEGEEFGDGN